MVSCLYTTNVFFFFFCCSTFIVDSSSFDMCHNRTFRGSDLNVIFDPLTALTGVTKRRQILCTCAVVSPESFNTTLIDARMACNKTIYCEAPLVSGVPGLNSQCVDKKQDSKYFHHNVDLGSGVGPEFNITFDSLCPPEHLWLALSGWYTILFNIVLNGDTQN